MPTTKSDTDPLTTALPEDAFKTEQDTSGPDPVTPTVEPTEKVETIEQQGIGAKDPYPTGNPPTPKDAKANVPNEGIQSTKKGK